MRAALKGFCGTRWEGGRGDEGTGDHGDLYDENDLSVMTSDEMLLRRKQRRGKVKHIEARGGNC